MWDVFDFSNREPDCHLPFPICHFFSVPNIQLQNIPSDWFIHCLHYLEEWWVDAHVYDNNNMSCTTCFFEWLSSFNCIGSYVNKILLQPIWLIKSRLKLLLASRSQSTTHKRGEHLGAYVYIYQSQNYAIIHYTSFLSLFIQSFIVNKNKTKQILPRVLPLQLSNFLWNLKHTNRHGYGTNRKKFKLGPPTTQHTLYASR